MNYGIKVNTPAPHQTEPNVFQNYQSLSIPKKNSID